MERRSGGDHTQQTNVRKGKVQVGTKETHDNNPKGADSVPPSSRRHEAGRNHLNKYNFLPTGTGERYSQTMTIICLAAPFRRCERPYKRNAELTLWALDINQHSYWLHPHLFCADSVNNFFKPRPACQEIEKGGEGERDTGITLKG